MKEQHPAPPVEFSTECTSTGSGALMCPCCREYYLHQDRVEIFDRNEDAETGKHFTIEGEHVYIDSDMARNPSSRRHGLVIWFRCENCCEYAPAHRLAIVQHKGNTFMEWTR